MNRFFPALIGLVLVVGIGAIAWYHLRGDDASVATTETGTPAAAADAPLVPPPPPARPPELRVPDQSAAEPAFVLPPLSESDVALRGELQTLVGKAPFEAYFVPMQIVRRWVGFIDSLDRDGVPLPQRPAKSVAGRPVVEADASGQLVLAAANAQRYKAYLAVLQAVDAQMLVTFYFRYYPLFQQAYGELGYGSDHYFNARLLAVIDHLLAAPTVDGPIALVQPKVLYQYADPSLESLSFGQKALIRIGPDNAAAVKAKLREIRAAIVARAEPAPSSAANPG